MLFVEGGLLLRDRYEGRIHVLIATAIFVVVYNVNFLTGMRIMNAERFLQNVSLIKRGPISAITMF